MIKDEVQVGVILRELQERAKELNCLYKVDELLNRPDLSLEEIFRAMIAVLPPGWQYPHWATSSMIHASSTRSLSAFVVPSMVSMRRTATWDTGV